MIQIVIDEDSDRRLEELKRRWGISKMFVAGTIVEIGLQSFDSPGKVDEFAALLASADTLPDKQELLRSRVGLTVDFLKSGQGLMSVDPDSKGGESQVPA